MNNGAVGDQHFTETIAFENPLNLVIIPVNIRGEIFRFLFDTGAPNAISVELQQKFLFDEIDKRSIRDSQGKTKKVKYVELDTISLGAIDFMETAAFIVDFKANPVLDCLDLDGILGSNLMRFCTWRVDYSNKTLVFTNQPEKLPYSADYRETSFKTNEQHAIRIDFKVGKTTIKNLKIDYGSTSSVSVPSKAYKTLKDNGYLTDPMTEVGFSQSGIFGEFVADTTEYGVINSGKIDAYDFGKVEIKNGEKSLFGSGVLKNYVVTMNWPKRTIGFEKLQIEPPFVRNRFGLSPAFYNENVIVKSIIVNGPAHNSGLTPGMIIKAIDDFEFEGIEDFCSYILRNTKSKHSIFIQVDLQGSLKSFEIKARPENQ